MNIKNNKRYKDMEIHLESTALKLMKKMDFEKITVKKICEKAGVNRSTFYAHFLDIYDMLDKMESYLHNELMENYSDLYENSIFSPSSFILFLKHIRKHSYFYRIALESRRSFPLKQGYEEMWNRVIKPQCQKAGVSSEDEMMYYFVYYQAGFTMVIKHWLDTQCEKSEEEVAEIIENCLPVIWR